ncbi:MAG: corrinoid protein [Deltaproteobacteria bacterium]|nr:corrinoid protein [Deltaproteobacteria bacterium]
MTVDNIKEIYGAIVEGRVEEAAGAVEKALDSGATPHDILNEGLISAMDLVGEKFGEGEYFIPQVMWAAKAMQAGMDVLKPHLAAGEQTDRGKIIIGTAKGDIHDIGKNLVSIMMEGAGFKVIDLGVDVEASTFVERAQAEGAGVIAISALLTTTMQSMAEVVALIREKNLSPLKVLVGGAPVDRAFCEEIGADAYGVDAVDGVRKARELMGV